MTREQGTRVENNRKSIQESKGNTKNNIREIFCIKANLRDQVDRIERLEKQVKSQETALISQERKLEDLEEVIRKRGDGIQAQNSKVDILSQPTYQEIPVQFVTVTSQNPNQLLEPHQSRSLLSCSTHTLTVLLGSRQTRALVRRTFHHLQQPLKRLSWT